MSLLLRPVTPSPTAEQGLPFDKTPMGESSYPHVLLKVLALYLSPNERYTFSRVCKNIRAIVLLRDCWTPEIHLIMTAVKGPLPVDYQLPESITAARKELVHKLGRYRQDELLQVTHYEPIYAQLRHSNPLKRFLVDCLAHAWTNLLSAHGKPIHYTIEAKEMNIHMFESLLLGLIGVKSIISLTVKCELTSSMVKCLAAALRSSSLKLEKLELCSHLTSMDASIIFNALNKQKELVHLEIGRYVLSENDLKLLFVALQGAQKLASLVFHNVSCSNQESRAFCKILLIPNLQRIEIKYFTGNLLKQLYQVIRITKVREFILQGGAIDFDTCSYLYEIKAKTSLELSDLRNTRCSNQQSRTYIFELWKGSQATMKAKRKRNLAQTL